jgi:elongation factor Ts
MQITAEMVRDLREKTGAGMMDCKKALTEANGEMEQAVDILRTKGLAAAAKKAGRIASEGVVAANVAGGAGAIVEVNCETDFVAKTDDFVAFVGEVAAIVREKAPADNDAALALPAGAGTVADLVTEKVAKIGEKLSFRRFARFALPAGTPGVIATYLHMGGKIGVMVEITGSDKEEVAALGRDLAMQVAAVNPGYVRREEVPAEVIEREKAIYIEQMQGQGKPEAMLEKIAAGKLEKFYGDVCLVEQVFVKDQDKKVTQLVKEVGAKVGAELAVTRFSRFQVGEGLEKKSEDFAAEVAKTMEQA